MQKKPTHRLGWSLLLIGGLAWLCVGCNPATISMFMMPWSDNKVDPDYKMFAGNKEIKLVILSNFAQVDLTKDEIVNAEKDLAKHIAEYIRKRCSDNKHKIKIVPQIDVHNFQLNIDEGGPLRGEELALAAGRKFKTDFVLDLKIGTLELYQPRSVPRMFLGNAAIEVSLYKTDKADDAHRVFDKEYRTEFPSTGPIPAGNSPVAPFRGRFLTQVSRDISKMLIAFPSDERMDPDGSRGEPSIR